MLKNWWFWTVVLEKTLDNPLVCKEIKPVNPKVFQPWIFIARTETPSVEAETPILWSPDAKSWLIGKDPDAGKDWWQEEKGTTEQDGWMASLTPWTWVWANCGRWWRAGKPGVLQSMGSQRVRHVEWLTTAIVFVNRGFSLASNKIVTTRQMRINSEIKLWFPKGKPTSISVTLICMQIFKIPQLVCPYVKMCYLLLEDWITM